MKLKKKISLFCLSLICIIASVFAVQTAFTPVGEKAFAEAPTLKYLYLSDLANPTPVELENGNTYAINSTMNPGDVKNGAITLKIGSGLCEQEFSKAVTFNRRAGDTVGGIKYNIAGIGATRFTANVGLNIITGEWGLGKNANAGTAAFRVYGDGAVLWDSGASINYEQQSLYVDVDVTGKSEIYLAAYDIGATDHMSEHVVYANPKLYGPNLVGGTECNSIQLSEFPISYIDFQDWYDASTVAINYGYPYADVNYPPLQLKVNGERKNFEKGISVQANAKFGYDISSTNAYRLTATIGLQQRDNMELTGENPERGSVQFVVNYRWNGGEDQNLYTSKIFYRGTDAEEIDIQIPYGASHVSFIVNDAGDGINFDNATWADLKLWCDSVYLSDMTVADYSVGFSSLMFDQVAEGKPTLNNYINENGSTKHQEVQFEKCIFMHDPSHVTFDVRNMNVHRFTAFVGIVSDKLPTYTDGWVQPVTYELYWGHGGDGKTGTTWYMLETASYSMKRTDQMKKIDYNNITPEMEFFKIVAYPTNGDSNSGHAVVCAPMFFGNNVYGTKSISLSPSNDSLVSGQTANVKLYATSFNNVVTEKTNFTLSSTTDTFTVNNTNKTYTAVKAGEGAIRVNYVENGQTFETFFNAVGGTTSGDYAQLVVKSPDGKTNITITRHNGWVDYSASKDGKMIVEKSRMGLDAGGSIGALKMNFTSATIGTQKTINETYKTYSGKYATNTNYCNENTITFTHNSGVKLTVIARAYNDGVAFRYQVTNTGGEFSIVDEQTSVTIPGFSKFWTMPMPAGSQKHYTHEQYASEQVISSYTGAKTIPLTYKTPDGLYVLLTEADMNGTYWGSVAWSEGEKTLRLGHSEQQTTHVTSSNGFIETPWRAFIAGSLEEMVKSNMVENLADAPDSKYDFSWVDPGISSWSWMSGLNNRVDGPDWWDNRHGAGYQGNPEAIKNYIDLAAEMGWEYFILDEGWQPWVNNSDVTWGNIQIPGNSYWNDTQAVGTWQNFPKWYYGIYDFMVDTDANPELAKYVATADTLTYEANSYTGTPIMEYAKQKGVKLIAWLHTGICDTPERMDKVFGMLHDIGIAGIKIDFFDSESNDTMAMYDLLYEKTAQNKLLGIFHGSNKPSGERRTWPHVLNREAINGEENNNTKVYQHTISGYVRGTVGPTDLTPYIYTVGKGDTNMAAQMAFSIIYESGLTCFASTDEQYRALDSNVKYYYKNFPGSWTDMKLLSGEIGKSMTVARKAETGKWYIGNIGIKGATETINLDFLDSGKTYIAHIYQDKATRAQEVVYSSQQVTKGGQLTLTTHNDGGYVVVLEDQTSHKISISNPTGVTLTTYPASACIGGNTVTVTINAQPAYTVETISIKGATYSETIEVASNTVNFIMPGEPVTISATTSSVLVTNAITVNKMGEGTVSTDKTMASQGETVTINASPATGYKLSSITVNGSVISGNTFQMPNTAVTINVTFTKISYSITCAQPNNGYVFIETEASSGQTVTFSVDVDEGYVIGGISVKTASGKDVICSKNGENYSFTMPAEDVVVSVTLVKDAYAITVIVNGNGTASASHQNATQGTMVTVTIAPEVGYVVTNVTINGNSYDVIDDKVTFEMFGEAVEVRVFIEEDQTIVSSSSSSSSSSSGSSSGVTISSSSQVTSSSSSSKQPISVPKDNNSSRGGCFGSVGASVALMPLMAIGLAVLIRKGKKND